MSLAGFFQEVIDEKRRKRWQLDIANHNISIITLSLTNALQSRLVTQAVLTTLHDKSKTRVDGFNGLLLLKMHKEIKTE